MNLAARVKNILVNPRDEWQVIDRETPATRELYMQYIVPLAAIGPVSSVIGMSLVGVRVPFAGTFRISFGLALTHGVVSYALSLVGVYVMALIVNALAPTFAGQKDMNQALKVIAYSSTAAWLAGIFSLIPSIGFLGLLGLYSLYLLYRGLPVLMKAPEEKAMLYTVVVVICAVVVLAAFGLISGAFLPMPEFPGMPGPGPGGR